MAEQLLKTIFQVRRGTSAEWTQVNPVLRQAEPAYETDTGKVKWGDGITPYRELPYQKATAEIDVDALSASISSIYGGNASGLA